MSQDKDRKKHKVRKAILPVAGFGTRFLPATKAQPKEMLPVVDKPAIQYIVEGIVASGITEIIFVTGRGRRILEDHFDTSPELEGFLEGKKKNELAEEMRKISNLARFTYVRQDSPLGNGHALLQAEHLLEDEPVLVIFGDCLYDSNALATKELLEAYEEFEAPIIGLTTTEEDVSQFGIVAGVPLDKKNIRIERIIEKPTASEMISNLVVPGKYILTKDVFRALREAPPHPHTGERGLTDAFHLMLSRGENVYGRVLPGTWLDTGDKFNFVKAAIHMGLKHPEIGEKLKAYLRALKI